jgi:predicted kinase
MSSKFTSTKPFIVMMYGYPGSGKTAFARQLAEEIGAVQVQQDRIRHELFGERAEDAINNSGLTKVAHYMAREFLKSGVPVIYDSDVLRASDRRAIREMAFETKTAAILVWLQIDPETAYIRTQRRDRRKTDDKYSKEYTEDSFRAVISTMQNPGHEEYVVISGKHTFQTQRGNFMKKLYDMGLVDPEISSSKVVKPELVNLIPQRNIVRGPNPPRNISIR